MRHRKKFNQLGRKKGHRMSMLANMWSSLIIHKRINTTHAKAKALKRFIEPLITFARKGDLHSRRQVLKKIPKKEIVRELFEKIGPMFENRNGGYTRLIKLGFRENDCAPISIIELVDFQDVVDVKSTKAKN